MSNAYVSPASYGVIAITTDPQMSDRQLDDAMERLLDTLIAVHDTVSGLVGQARAANLMALMNECAAEAVARKRRGGQDLH